MKKLIKTVTIILLSFLLIACSGEPQQDQQQEPKQEEVVEEIKEEESEQEEVVEEEIKEEEKEESEEKTPKEEMKYWIVFFNPDGRELQRTAEKYGSTPKYESEEPVYWDADYWYNFVGWTDKDGNDITEFKPITGNKYIYAKYEIGGVIEPEPEPDPIPVTPPAPACTETAQIVYFTRYHGIMGYYYKVYTYNSNDGKFHLTASSNSSTFSGVEVGKYYHAYGKVAWTGCVYTECADITAHTLEES